MLNDYIHGFATEHLSIIFPHKSTSKTPKPSPKATIQAWPDNSVLITIGSFVSDNNPSLQQSLQRLIALMPNLRDKKFIIIDLRNNGGGDGQYARPLISALYSQAYLESLGPLFPWNSQWRYRYRLSKAFIAESLNYPDDPETKEALKAYHKHQAFFDMTTWPLYHYQHKQQDVRNPVNAKILLLSNNKCTSMCYQMIRTWLYLPHVYLIGQAPDTMALITNPVLFPISKYSSLDLASTLILAPQAIFNVPLEPHYHYPGDIQQSPAVFKWIKQLIADQKFS